MRIAKLHIEGFGIFTDRELPQQGELAEGLNVIHGPNEAGKSTVLAFIQAVLFGFPRANSEDHIPALYSDTFGGSITVVDNDGASWVVSRHRGRKPQLQLQRPDGGEGDEADLATLVHNFDDSIFRAVFGFDLSDIAELQGMDDKRISSRISNAGLRGSAAPVEEIFKELDKRMAPLLRERKTDTAIRQSIDAIKTNEKELKLLTEKAASHPELKNELETLGGEIISLKDRRNQLGEKGLELKTLVDLWPHARDTKTFSKEIEELEAPEEFPADGLSLLEKAQEGVSSNKVEVEEAEGQLEKLRARLAPLAADEKLLGFSTDAEALKSELPLILDRKGQLGSARGELASLEKSFSNTINELGEGWSRELVEVIKVGIEREEEARKLADRLSLVRNELERATNNFSDAGKSRFSPKVAIAIIVLGVLLGAGGFFTAAPIQTFLWFLCAAFMVIGSIPLFGGGGGSDDLSRETAAKKELEVTLARWEELLESWKLGLPSRPEPDTALRIFARLDKAKVELSNLKAVEDKISDLKGYVAAWEEKARGKVEGIVLLDPAASIENNVRSVAEKVLSEKEKQLEARKLAGKIETFSGQFDKYSKLLKEDREKISGLLKATGSPDAVHFRLLGKNHARKVELEAAMRDGSSRIDERLGEGDRAKQLRKILDTGEVVEWEMELAQTRTQYSDLDSSIDEKNKGYGELNKALEDMESSDEIGRIGLAVEVARSQGVQAASSWRVLSLAHRLLEKSLAKYSEEHQPAVMELASKTFSAITGGRYPHVRQPHDEDQPRVIRENGDSLRPSELSRGTREELYVSMRLALAMEFGKRGTHLPLIADDVFVNFDPDRRDAALAQLCDYARSAQVIFFTCHPDTVKKLRTLDPTAKIMDLKI